MTYEILASEFGREPVEWVEIDLDFCENRYGVSPCTASVGVTGTRKCFNTFSDCQDPSNYNKGTKTYRFYQSDGKLVRNVQNGPANWPNTFPCLLNVNESAALINTDGGLGQRGKWTIKCQDFTYNDSYTDPYRTERDYNPEDQGTFFGKLKARNLYYENRPFRHYTGFIERDANGTPYIDYDNVRVFHGFITRMSGPGNGAFQIEAKDVLSFTDNNKAQIPEQTDIILLVDIDEVTTSIDKEDIDGTFKLQYSGEEGYIRIDDEILWIRDGGGTSYDVTRGLWGTTAEEHGADTEIAEAYAFFDLVLNTSGTVGTGVKFQDALETILVDFAGIDSSYIPKADWDEEVDTFAPNLRLTRVLTDPEGTNAILTDLAQNNVPYRIWWDAEVQEVKLRLIRPVINPDEIISLNDDINILRDKFDSKDFTEKRLTRTWTYYNFRNQVEDFDKGKNYSNVQGIVDSNLESDNAYGQPQAYQAFGSWLTTSTDAGQYNGFIINQYTEPPLRLEFYVDAKDEPDLGNVLAIEDRNLTDETGAPQQRLFDVISVKEISRGHKYAIKCVQNAFSNVNGLIFGRYAPGGEFTLNMTWPTGDNATWSTGDNATWGTQFETSVPDFDNATLAQKALYAWYDSGYAYV